MLKLEDDVVQLIKLSNNLKKSINNKHRKETLIAKSNYAKELFSDIEQSLLDLEDKIPLSKLNFLIKSSRDAHLSIITIVNNKLSLLTEEDPTVPIMAQFDLKMASSLLQTYDGSPESLNAFTDGVNLLLELNDANHHPMLLKFVKTRLTGKARVGLPDNIASIPDLLTNIKNRCEEKTSAESVIAKLKSIKIKDNVETFCTEIENLTSKLKNIYVGQQIPDDVAGKMATKIGVDTLINNTVSQETKIILKVGDFADIKTAIQKVQENVTANTHIFHVKRGVVSNQNFRNNRSRGQNFTNYQRNNPGRQYQNSFQYRNFGQNRGRGGFNMRNNRGGNHFRGGNFQRRVYHTQLGNHLGPQQHYQVGGQPPTQMPQQSQMQHVQLMQQQPTITYQNLAQPQMRQ